MATIEFPGIKAYQKQLEQLGSMREVEKMLKYAIYPAAGEVLDAIRSETPVDTGDLRDSETLTKYRTEDGYVYTQVSFAGYDRKGTPNVVKARVLESGSSNQKKRPFIRKAVRRVERKAEQLMQTALDKYLYDKFRK